MWFFKPAHKTLAALLAVVLSPYTSSDWASRPVGREQRIDLRPASGCQLRGGRTTILHRWLSFAMNFTNQIPPLRMSRDKTLNINLFTAPLRNNSDKKRCSGRFRTLYSPFIRFPFPLWKIHQLLSAVSQLITLSGQKQLSPVWVKARLPASDGGSPSAYQLQLRSRTFASARQD